MQPIQRNPDNSEIAPSSPQNYEKMIRPQRNNGITSSNFFRKKDAHAAQTGTVVNITNKYGTLFSLSLLRKNPPLLHLKTNEKQKNIYAYFYSDLGIGKQPIESRNQ